MFDSFYEPQYFKVDIGLFEIKSPDSWSLKNRKLSKIVVHPQYNDDTFMNDIALMKLKVM